VQRFVVRVIFCRQETAFGIGHLAEVIFDVFGKVPRRLDRVEGPVEAAIVTGGVGAAPVAESRRNVRGRDGGVWPFLTGCGIARGSGAVQGGGVGLGPACFSFALVAEGFSF